MPAGTISQTTRGVFQLGDEFVGGRRADRALAHERRDRVGRNVAHHAFVPRRHEATNHVRSHAAEPDHAHLHSILRSGVRGSPHPATVRDSCRYATHRIAPGVERKRLMRKDGTGPFRGIDPFAREAQPSKQS
jgi:hypothetical protein